MLHVALSTGQVPPAQQGKLVLPHDVQTAPVHTVFVAEHAAPVATQVFPSQQPFAHAPPAQQTWPVEPHAVHEPPAHTVLGAWHAPPEPTQRLEPGSQHAEPLQPAPDAQHE